MSVHLTWFTGQLDPSISETITAGGTAVDLTGKTVKFKMRPVNSSTLTVDADADVVSAAAGTVRYDWDAADVDTAGFYLVWWEVTTTSTGNKQDMNEAVIEIRDHAPISQSYVELEELKSSLELTGNTFADQDLRNAIAAASRGIDEVTGSRFYPSSGTLDVRYYSPSSSGYVNIDHLITLTSFQTDPLGSGSFSETWTQDSHFVLEPLNADGTVLPWTTVRVHPRSLYRLPLGYPRSVKVTGKFGWNTPPEAVKTATTIIATRLLRRAREAPFGVVAVGLDGEAIRIARFDSDISFLLAPYTRTQALIG